MQPLSVLAFEWSRSVTNTPLCSFRLEENLGGGGEPKPDKWDCIASRAAFTNASPSSMVSISSPHSPDDIFSASARVCRIFSQWLPTQYVFPQSVLGHFQNLS